MTTSTDTAPPAGPAQTRVLSPEQPLGRFLYRMLAERYTCAEIEYGTAEVRRERSGMATSLVCNLSQAQMAAEVLDETEAFLRALGNKPWSAPAKIRHTVQTGHVVEVEFEVSAFKTPREVARQRLERLGITPDHPTEMTTIRLLLSSRRRL